MRQQKGSKPKLPPRKRGKLQVEIKKTARTQIAAAINQDWRKLAEDAVKAYRDLANYTAEGTVLRDRAQREASSLGRRLATLSGQMEMFAS